MIPFQYLLHRNIMNIKFFNVQKSLPISLLDRNLNVKFCYLPIVEFSFYILVLILISKCVCVGFFYFVTKKFTIFNLFLIRVVLSLFLIFSYTK